MFDQQCVNNVSRCFSLLLFLWLVFQIQLADIFFQLPVCECPLALSQLNFWWSVSIVSVFFVGNIACTWIAVSQFGIASQFDILPFAFCETWLWTWRFDLNIHIKLQKTSETSKRFSALKAIYRLMQCNPLLKHRTICHHGSCSHKLGNETVHVYQVPLRKKNKPNFTRD